VTQGDKVDSIEANDQETFLPILTAAEQLLSKRFSCPIRLGSVERLSEEDRRNLLLRCTIVEATGHIPSSIIIKKVETENYDPSDTESWDIKRFFSDWAGAEFLSTVSREARHSPRFYDGDRMLGFILLEDMGRHHHSLVEPLLQEDAASAEKALLTFVRRLGQMHADSLGQATMFEYIVRAISPTAVSPVHDANSIRQQITSDQTTLESLVPVEPQFEPDLETVIAVITNPGPFFTYIHGDPCPDNVFYTGDSLRLIDFEFGRFGHALLDAVYGRMMFPTCWCANRLPEALVAQMERTYRTELAQTCPAAQDNHAFETALVEACAFWLLDTLNGLLKRALAEDRRWGISLIRPRILARLESFITISEQFNHLPGIRGTASRLLTLLQKRWPATAPLPLYPAFRQ
jgi:hypothetical protein